MENGKRKQNSLTQADFYKVCQYFDANKLKYANRVLTAESLARDVRESTGVKVTPAQVRRAIRTAALDIKIAHVHGGSSPMGQHIVYLRRAILELYHVVLELGSNIPKPDESPFKEVIRAENEHKARQSS